VSGVLPPFVDAAWLAAHRDDVVLADVRWYLDGRSGAAAFADGHLPGAVFIDLDRWLAAPADPRHGRHPLPDPEVFAPGMGEAGIGDDATVIARATSQRRRRSAPTGACCRRPSCARSSVYPGSCSQWSNADRPVASRT
jgi:3-mercaptopyruvate sulfurtransferase SseA